MTTRTQPAARKPRDRNRIQTIKLAPYDDVTSIRDRLQFVELERVLLILPSNAPILRKKIDLLLIQREASRRHLQIALMTADPEVMEHALTINISVFTTTRQARSRRWKQPRNQFFGDRDQPYIGQNPYDLMPVATRLKRKKSPQWARLLGRLMIGLIMLITVGGGTLAAAPSATVTISPAADTFRESFTVYADPNAGSINIFDNVIPAEKIQLVIPGGTVTVETTGRRDAEDSLAEGRVVFTNQSNQAIFIPIGTIVRTELQPFARFRTTVDARLPAQQGASVEVKIIALPESAGLNGNVLGGYIARIEGELETLISVTNPDPTFGGGIVQESVVTEADHDRLLVLGRAAVEQSARSQLLLQLPQEGKLLIPDSVAVIEERPEWRVFSADIGEAVDNVSLDMRGLVEATVIDELEVRQLGLILISRSLPPNRNLNEESLTYYTEIKGRDDLGRIELLVTVEGNSYYAIDTSQIASRIKGQSTDEAIRTLENELLLDPRYPPEIKIQPFSIGRLPLVAVRINVVVVPR